MSEKIAKKEILRDGVNVDYSILENCNNSEITDDSGVYSCDPSSNTLLNLANTENVSTNGLKNASEGELNSSSKNVTKEGITLSLPSSKSLTPDLIDATENLLSFDEFSLNKFDGIIGETDHILTEEEELKLEEFIAEAGILNVDKASSNCRAKSENDLLSDSQDTSENLSPDLENFHRNLARNESPDFEDSHNLATSTISLNDQKTVTNTKISKSPYSRSAENISTIEQNLQPNKELNTEEILNEFANQKSKVVATQKIPEPVLPLKTVPESLDLRYARIPKELLSQDIGSIVKNVHGIFSSVSGSLKNAYIHQRGQTQKPIIKNIPKPITNGKIMSDIFEDETLEKSEQNIENNAEKLPETTKIIEDLNKVSDLNGLDVDNDVKKDVLKLQVEALERLLSEQRRENSSLRERVKQHVDELQEKDQMFKELESKLDLMGKRVEHAEREKDAAVMRYASVECTAIEARRTAEKAQAAEKAALAEAELLQNKIKSAHAEKQRICQLYDDKCHELSNFERELGKLREEIKEMEGRLKWTQSKLRCEMDAYKGRLKWTQSKLRCEMDAYKESSERADKLAQQVTELEAAKEAAVTNAADSIRAKLLEQELKESQATLILLRHEREELERRLTITILQLETCKKERDSNNSALARTTAEVERLQASNLRLEEEAAELAALRAQASLADTLSAQLQRETERAQSLEEALRLEKARAETCARREAAALEHAAELTQLHVAERATSSDHHAKAQALALDNASLRERVAALEQRCGDLQAALTEETERRNKENRMLARKVAELTEEAADACKKLEWEKGENDVLKKKHSSAIKELNRELHRALKRCEQLEAKLPTDTPSTRTGSISSLSSGESAPPEERTLPNGHVEARVDGRTDGLPDVQVREPDRQTLIERIVSLQRAAARRAERCDFLEEHSKQLTAELRAKSKLLRHLLSNLPAGAVSNQDSDAHKREIARLGGGAMAAVWGGDSSGMTLELSLEMNKRLQAVLEDALLKNITLKDNMDTLGEEIARLKEQKAPENKK